MAAKARGLTSRKVGYVMLALAALYALGKAAPPDGIESAAVASSRILDFETERRGLQSAIGSCRTSKVAPPFILEGRLYWCVNGHEETAKLFINENPKRPGTVLNIKMMWNEWKAHMPEAGADQREASRMARAVMKRYAPALEEDVLYAFWGKDGKTFRGDGFRFDYTWTPGPGIDEHLLVVSSDGGRRKVKAATLASCRHRNRSLPTSFRSTGGIGAVPRQWPSHLCKGIR